jgi:hypothetical protein
MKPALRRALGRQPDAVHAPVVQHLDRDVGPVGQGAAERRNRLGIGTRALQEAAIAADDLVQRIAGELREGAVG